MRSFGWCLLAALVVVALSASETTAVAHNELIELASHLTPGHRSILAEVGLDESEDVPKPKSFKKVSAKIGELIEKLLKEREDIVQEQAERHRKLAALLEKKEETCQRAAYLKGVLDKKISEANELRDILAKYFEEHVVAVSVQAKNKKANDMLRADMVNEEQLLRQLIALIDKLHGLEFGSDSKGTGSQWWKSDSEIRKRSRTVPVSAEEAAKLAAEKASSAAPKGASAATGSAASAAKASGSKRHLLSEASEGHSKVALTKEDLMEIKQMIAMLTVRDPVVHAKMMGTIDLERKSFESQTLKSLIEGLLEDIDRDRATMKAQEERDAHEVARLKAEVDKYTALFKKAQTARDQAAKEYHAQERQCEKLSGELREAAKLSKIADEKAKKDISVINEELETLYLMKKRLGEYMEDPGYNAEAEAKKAKELKAKVAEAKAKMEHATEKEAADAKAAYDKIVAEEEAHRKKMEAKAAKDAKILAEQQRQAQEAQDHANKAAAEAAKKEADADAAYKAAKAKADAEGDRASKEAAAEAKARADSDAVAAQHAAAAARCIKIVESVYSELVNQTQLPQSVMEKCVRMPGDDDAVKAGVTRIVKGTKVFGKHMCVETVTTLVHDLLKRNASTDDMKDYVDDCVKGQTQDDIIQAIKASPEYQMRIKTPHRAHFCLQGVRRLYRTILQRRPRKKEVLHWSSLCVKGLALHEIAEKFRESDEYKELHKAKQDEKAIAEAKEEAAHARLSEAKAKIFKTTWAGKHHADLRKQRKEAEDAAKARQAAHDHLLKILRKKRSAYRKWFKKWQKQKPSIRAEWWKMLTDATYQTCDKRREVCASRKHRLQQYREAHSALQRVQMAAEYASNKVRKCDQPRTKCTRARKDAYARRASRLQRKLAALVPKVKALKLQRHTATRGCRVHRVRCRVVMHRFHYFVREKTNWLRSRLRVWRGRAKEAKEAMVKAYGKSERAHYDAVLKSALDMATKLRFALKDMYKQRAAWAEARERLRKETWAKRITAWRRYVQCKSRSTKLAEQMRRKFDKAVRIAHRVVQRRADLLKAAHQATDATVGDMARMQARRALHRYRRASRIARRVSTMRDRLLRRADVCNHRAIHTMQRARQAVLRRARLLSARRISILRRARAKLAMAKATPAWQDKKTQARLVGRFRAAIRRAQALATMAQAGLNRAQNLSERAAKVAARLDAYEILADRRHRARAARRLKAAARRAVATTRVAKARRAELRAERRRRDAAWVRKQERIARARKYRAKKSLFAKHTLRYAVAGVTGDPHVTTFHGRHILLGSGGDFYLVQGRGFQCQARSKVLDKEAHAAVMTGIVCKLPSTSSLAGDVVEISGEGVQVNRKTIQPKLEQNALAGGSLFVSAAVKGSQNFKLSMTNGVFANINTNKNGAVNAYVAVPQKLLRGARGLLLDRPGRPLATESIDEQAVDARQEDAAGVYDEQVALVAGKPEAMRRFRAAYSLFAEPLAQGMDDLEADPTVSAAKAQEAAAEKRHVADVAAAKARRAAKKAEKAGGASSGYKKALREAKRAEKAAKKAEADAQAAAAGGVSSSAGKKLRATQRVVKVDAIAAAHEVCATAFADAKESVGKCTASCQQLAGLPKDKCVIDLDLVANAPIADRRACQCVFDVSVAGSSYAAVDAAGAALADETRREARRGL